MFKEEAAIFVISKKLSNVARPSLPVGASAWLGAGREAVPHMDLQTARSLQE
jgi:hypothetical protein